MTAKPTLDGVRADISRRLARTRAQIEHIEDLERRHGRDPVRGRKLAEERKAAEIDCGRLQAQLAELDSEPAQ